MLGRRDDERVRYVFKLKSIAAVFGGDSDVDIAAVASYNDGGKPYSAWETLSEVPNARILTQSEL